MGHYVFVLGGVGLADGRVGVGGVYNLYWNHTFTIFLSSVCYNNRRLDREPLAPSDMPFSR